MLEGSPLKMPLKEPLQEASTLSCWLCQGRTESHGQGRAQHDGGVQGNRAWATGLGFRASFRVGGFHKGLGFRASGFRVGGFHKLLGFRVQGFAVVCIHVFSF